ncbi:MAG: PAS domain-containing protein [Chloroflexi bacterium]|nr:PAS domain-containing protein [Chloroflexota bacterium]
MTASSRERLQSLGIALASIGGVIIADVGGLLVYANDEVRRLMRRQLSPRLTWERFGADLRLRHSDGNPLPLEQAPLSRALRGETVVDGLLQIANPDGGDLYVSWTASPAKDEKGDVFGAISILRDATERVEAERQQARAAEMLRAANQRLIVSALAAEDTAEREQERRKDVESQQQERGRLLDDVQRLADASDRRAAQLMAVIHNMVDAVFVYDAGGRVSLTNEAGMSLLAMAGSGAAEPALPGFPAGLPARHLDGKPILPEEAPLARALKGEPVEKDDMVIAGPDAGRDVYVRLSAAPIKDESGIVMGAVVVVRDLTEIMELDRLKDQFIVTAAHELKTPVTAIKGYAQLLLKRSQEGVGPQAIKALQAINRQSDRISGLVNDLLDISRLTTGRMEMVTERVNLSELAEEVVDRMALTTTNHHIRVVKAEPVVVKGDKERLGEVLTNLIDNAIKFSPKGGPYQGRIDVAVDIAGDEAVVSVKDYGVGIPKEKQHRIFQSFYRAHAGTPFDFGGIGVGLFISKEIVTRHGGRMWFESEEGKGSTFYFSVPIGKSRRRSRRTDAGAK